jgi:hypothetical protein
MKSNGATTALKSKNSKAKNAVTQAKEESDTTTPEYEVVDGRMVGLIRDRKGRLIDVPIANFAAKIIRTVVVDDGAEESRYFDIEVTVGSETFFVRDLPATEFASLDWVIPCTNGRGRILPDKTARVRDAIQYLSGKIPVVTHYGHLGWQRVKDYWFYLHAGGAIGEQEAASDIAVTVGDKFVRFVLPDPAQVKENAISAAVRAALKLLDVAPRRVTAPLLCMVGRTPLGAVDYSIHLVGPTGVGKTVLAALMQQFWGAGLDWQHCPASWSSTANANEALRFFAKDTLIVQDDLAPNTASPAVIDRTFRGQGNSTGRDRMAADTSLRRTKYPRGSLLSTGEDNPFVQSAAARVLVLAVGPNDVKFTRVTKRQAEADAGVYALVLAAYVRWLAARYDEVLASRPKRVAELRGEFTTASQHKKTPGITAELMFGFETFLAFAVGINAVDGAQAGELRNQVRAALIEAADAQTLIQRETDPVAQFGTMLIAALTAGHAHVASKNGCMPLNSGAWGWRDGKPLGIRVGWVDGGDLYLNKDTTYEVLCRAARETGASLPTLHTLTTRLHGRGLLLSTEKKHETLTVRKVLEKVRRPVLHLAATLVLGEPDETEDDEE